MIYYNTRTLNIATLLLIDVRDWAVSPNKFERPNGFFVVKTIVRLLHEDVVGPDTCFIVAIAVLRPPPRPVTARDQTIVHRGGKFERTLRDGISSWRVSGRRRAHRTPTHRQGAVAVTGRVTLTLLAPKSPVFAAVEGGRKTRRVIYVMYYYY